MRKWIIRGGFALSGLMFLKGVYIKAPVEYYYGAMLWAAIPYWIFKKPYTGPYYPGPGSHLPQPKDGDAE